MPPTSTSKVKELMIMHERPGTPWIKVGTYLFKMCFNNYLIIPDYFSRYLVVKELSTTTADTVITATKETVSILNVPCEVVSDNGLQFLHLYNDFCSKWNIKHTTLIPRYPQSKDFIEKQNRYIKSIIKKCLRLGGDITRALFNVQATPLDTVLPNPAELMFRRPMKTSLSCRVQMAPDEYRTQINQSVAREKIFFFLYADQHTREIVPLLNGQQVRLLKLDLTNR